MKIHGNVNKAWRHRAGMMIQRKKGDVEWDHLIPWILGLLVLAVVIFLYFALSGRATGAVEFMKNFMRFGK